MKTRIQSALVGLVILCVVLYLIDTLVFNLVISIICLMAVYELLCATGCIQFKGLALLAVAMTLLIPFLRSKWVQPYAFLIIFVIVLLYFCLLLKNNGRMKVRHFAMTFVFSTIIPTFYSCAVFLRDDYGKWPGGFLMVLALGAAWLCDTGAYFVGRAFGRHKLAPNVSPKKTVEGAVGGVVVGTVLMLGLAWVYIKLAALAGTPVEINFKMLAICMPALAVVGMLGDLSASVIKREYGVKDFGRIMPGHGGILDRFDSVLFTLPSVYILAGHIEFVAAI